MKIEKISRSNPAPMSAIPARDSRAAVVTRPEPTKAPAPLVKLPGKVLNVKFPVNVRVKVVKVPEGVPVTNRREGFPITTRTSPTATSATLTITSLLTKRFRVPKAPESVNIEFPRTFPNHYRFYPELRRWQLRRERTLFAGRPVVPNRDQHHRLANLLTASDSRVFLLRWSTRTRSAPWSPC